MKTSWNSISLGNESEFPVIDLEGGKELVFSDFEDYREFVMTLVGMIGASGELPYDIVLRPKEKS